MLASSERGFDICPIVCFELISRRLMLNMVATFRLPLS
uniref:Uncharacterized protein n=1 Tax=Arundo donax TaxID=35708 RepID=A0A0A9EY14_ARUDO